MLLVANYQRGNSNTDRIHNNSDETIYISVVFEFQLQIWGLVKHKSTRYLETAPSTEAIFMSNTLFFAVAVKLNSADLQRGGFDVEDA